jgi:hypothetical protein
MWLLTRRAKDLVEELLPASRGVGPLLQRDYWAVVDHCRYRPSEVMEQVARGFWHFAPADLVRFRREDGSQAPLAVGDLLRVKIRMAGTFRVRVIHRDATSLTLGTLAGHPEAGRITFGAYRNDRGDVLFHIRSLARSSSEGRYVGFLAMGEAMQTNCWTDFVNTVAATLGEGVLGYVHAETVKLKDRREDDDALESPTFIARGD